VPFATEQDKQDHYTSHGHEFGAASPDDYVRMAEGFMSKGLSAGLREGARATNGDRVRFDDRTYEFAVETRDGILRTYYIVEAERVRGCGGEAAYFAKVCRQ
jgi:pyocin large subunit-like protein